MQIYICRCCLNEITDVRHSPADLLSQPGRPRPAFDYITCENRRCKLIGQTFSSVGYNEINLSVYDCSEHPDWAQLQARYNARAVVG